MAMTKRAAAKRAARKVATPAAKRASPARSRKAKAPKVTPKAAHVARAAARGAVLGALPGPIRGAVEHASAAAKNPRGKRKNPAGAPLGGRLMSRRVLAVEYQHADSAQVQPYRHDFRRNGVEMYAMPNGSIVMRHPTLRLWDVFTVSERE